MRCGIDPKGFFTSCYLFLCHRLSSPSLLQVSMVVPVHTTQVCPSRTANYVSTSLTPFALVVTNQVLDISFCAISINNVAEVLSTHVYDSVLRFVLSALLLILAVSRSLRQLLLMYKATKQWHLNRYMQRLTADGILYFIVWVFFSPSRSHCHVPRSFDLQTHAWRLTICIYS